MASLSPQPAPDVLAALVAMESVDDPNLGGGLAGRDAAKKKGKTKARASRTGRGAKAAKAGETSKAPAKCKSPLVTYQTDTAQREAARKTNPGKGRGAINKYMSTKWGSMTTVERQVRKGRAAQE